MASKSKNCTTNMPPEFKAVYATFRLGSTTLASAVPSITAISITQLRTRPRLLVDRRTDHNRTLYSLRHTYATMALLYERMEIHTLATQMGTSVLMIENHYSHLTPRMLAEQFAGVDFDALAAKKKVVKVNDG